ncbi:uncharacterized protein [Hyperolius riggenbachi]|uniref:uncharacterized protein n=1 Tax=Hyperolius riggenbachi TaxID=752182 RepID=UPI0035A2935E
MASAGLREELKCSICLSIYTDPVTLRCGHNFCRGCIHRVLVTQEGSGGYSCPECREKFQERPALQRNITLCNIVENFLSTPQGQEESHIFCGQCFHAPVPAVKSCLHCEVSLCENHLIVHKKSKEHVLCDPTTSTEYRKCTIHQEVLQYYCTEDAACVCVSCYVIGEHVGHKMVSLTKASESRKGELRNVQQEVMSQRQEIEKRVQSLEECRRKAQEKADDETERVTALFKDLLRRLEDLEKKVTSDITRQAERVSLYCDDIIMALEIKKQKLSRKVRHIEELCNMTDPLTVLQESPIWDTEEGDNEDSDSDTGDLCDTEEGDNEDSDSDTGDREVRDEDRDRQGGHLDVAGISHTLHTGLSDIMSGVTGGIYLQPADISLDVNTACNALRISRDRKFVSSRDKIQNRPETAERFQCSVLQVLSSQSFSSGRRYWEVDIGGSESWRVGMCYPSIARRGDESEIGCNKKSWGLDRTGDHYSVIHDCEEIWLPDKIPSERVRIYLDYEAGQISFYALCDPIRHLHTFTATFTEPLHAVLGVWEGYIKISGGRPEMLFSVSTWLSSAHPLILLLFYPSIGLAVYTVLRHAWLHSVGLLLTSTFHSLLLSAMASAGLREELECSICLSIYTDPVTLRCGHNFCRGCIHRVLDTQEGSGGYVCPECRKKFQERPVLQRNITLCNIVENFLSTQPGQEESQVFCSHCIHTPVPAVKSCLHCVVSLCEDHLRIHKKSPEHVLCDPTTSLEDRKCSIHHEVLKYYCTEDAACVCVSCYVIGEHVGHKMASLAEASESRKNELRNNVQEVMSQREKMGKRVQNVEEARRKAQEKVDDEKARVTVLFKDLRRNLEDLERKVMSDLAREAERVSLYCDDVIKELQLKKEELSKKMRHIEKLCNIAVPLTILQESNTGNSDTEGQDNEDGDLDGGDLDVAGITHALHTGLSNIISGVTGGIYIQPADISLDVDTANNRLQISTDKKTASWSDVRQNLPEPRERFFPYGQVLSSQIFSSGQHYWEVDVGGSVCWTVGMCYPSIARRGDRSLIGQNKKSWIFELDDGMYSARHEGEEIYFFDEISIDRVRIYLDYEAGQISFYALCDPIRHLHTFTATFTEPLHAVLGLWDGCIKISGGRSEM